MQEKPAANTPFSTSNGHPNTKRNAEPAAIKVWLQTITKLAENADAFVDACDYDLEGSIIGYCILKYACSGKEADAKRMKYSTLTREELQQAYERVAAALGLRAYRSGIGEARGGLALRHQLVARVDRCSKERQRTIHNAQHGAGAGTYPEVSGCCANAASNASCPHPIGP